jgi:putative ABC transport system permease protein
LLRFAVRSLWARKLRAVATVLAVFIGISLVAGTYVITDTINRAFDQIFKESLKGTAVVITNRQPVSQQSNQATSFSAGLLRKVRNVPGVEVAAGTVFTSGGIFNGNKAVGSQFAPKFISSTLPPQIEALTTVAGHRPRNAHQATLDKAAADDSGLRIGDPIRLAGERRARTYRLVGLTELGGASFGGASIAQLTLREAQLVTDNVGRFNQISVAASPGVNPDRLAARIERIAPASVRVETGERSANRRSNQIHKELGFLPTFLFVFAAVALVVGAFVIFNTFSITVAQRVREFGMLRTLGASRRQVLTSVFVEATAIGLFGAACGVAGGLGFATAIEALFKAVGIGLPTTTLVMQTRTVIISLLVGVCVTLLAALGPALRSTRVPPVAAIQDLPLVPSRRRSAIYAAVAALLAIGGVALVCVALLADINSTTQQAELIGAGAAATLLALALASPRLVRPLAAAAGAPLQRLRGLTGMLARENAQRNPARTAATSAALMIGLALVTFVAVFAAGLKASIADAIERDFNGQIELQNTDGFSPIPAAAAAAVRKVPGVETVSTLRSSQVKLEGIGGTQSASGLDPSTANEVLSIPFTGSTAPATLRHLTDGQTIVNERLASDHGLAVGNRITLLTQTGQHPSFRIAGTFSDTAHFLGGLIVTKGAMAREFAVHDDQDAFVRTAPGVPVPTVEARIKALVRQRFPTADVFNEQQLKDNQESSVNGLLGLVYALLSLAVIVSLFGIANTLALSIHERTRELGMLRAVGMSRRQVRRMIRYESVITALIGAVLGLAVGVIFAALISRPLSGQGFVLTYPIGQLAIVVAAAAIAGVLAAIGPARRAARLNVLEALAYE